MALTFADMSGVPAVRVRLVLPFTGIWHADVLLDRVLPAPLVGPQLLNLAGTQWTCAIVRAADFSGQRRARLVGGTGGWRTVLPSGQQFASPSGVPLATVLAATAGMALEAPPNLLGYTGSPIVGTAYIRQPGPASLVLQDLLGDSWWMDPFGVVQTAPRIATPILSPFAVIDVRGESGYYRIATDFLADWTPGRTFANAVVTSPVTISRVTHVLEGGTMRSEVLATP